MNVSVNDCMHLVELTFFDDEKHKKLNYLSFYSCYFTCDLNFQLSIACHETLNKTAKHDLSKQH